jgi:hypothetical protein
MSHPKKAPPFLDTRARMPQLVHRFLNPFGFAPRSRRAHIWIDTGRVSNGEKQQTGRGPEGCVENGRRGHWRYQGLSAEQEQLTAILPVAGICSHNTSHKNAREFRDCRRRLF